MDHHIIHWDNKYSIGDAEMDEQHQTLITMIAEIDELDDTGNDAIIDQLLDYSKYHFQAEQQYMQETGYPDLASHTIEHEQLLDTLHEHKKDYDASKINLFEFKNFLFFWVRDHIMDKDQDFGKFLANR